MPSLPFGNVSFQLNVPGPVSGSVNPIAPVFEFTLAVADAKRDTAIVTEPPAVKPSASVTAALTVEAPAAVGVPVIAPLDGLIESPAGSPLADHASPPAPPVALTDAP